MGGGRGGGEREGAGMDEQQGEAGAASSCYLVLFRELELHLFERFDVVDRELDV